MVRHLPVRHPPAVARRIPRRQKAVRQALAARLEPVARAALREIGSKGLCVAKMVTIAASTSYKIDVTEVTTGQYVAWYATNPALPSASDPACGWKADASQGENLAIDSAPSSDVTTLIYGGADYDHHPVYEVDWCDAYIYCKGVGKRLCGKIGGGTNAYDSFNDASASEWYRACSSGGIDKYPYGNTLSNSACNGKEEGAGATTTVGSLTTCQSSTAGYTGIFDMVGNVREWEDSCKQVDSTDTTGQSDVCRVRGSDFWTTSTTLACDYSDGTVRTNYGYNAVGFRCCADAG